MATQDDLEAAYDAEIAPELLKLARRGDPSPSRPKPTLRLIK